MLAPLVRLVVQRRELRDPKAYQVKFVPWYTIVGKNQGEGWYIIAPRLDPIGPIKEQKEAEDLLIAALEEIRGKPFTDVEKEKARERWRKD